MGPSVGASKSAIACQQMWAAPSTPLSTETTILVRSMTDVLVRERPESAAEALRVLRLMFPEYPLSLRLVAVASAMKWGERPAPYMPR